MKTWKRAETWLSCGADMGCLIRTGSPYLELQGSTWTKRRCADHAGEPVPPELPLPTPVAALAPLSFTSTRQLAGRLLRDDYKLRQAGDGE